MNKFNELYNKSDTNKNELKKTTPSFYSYLQYHSFVNPGRYVVFSNRFAIVIDEEIVLNKNALIEQIYPVLIASHSRLGNFETFFHQNNIVINNLNYMFVEHPDNIIFKIYATIFDGTKVYWSLYFQRKPNFIVDIINHNV